MKIEGDCDGRDGGLQRCIRFFYYPAPISGPPTYRTLGPEYAPDASFPNDGSDSSFPKQQLQNLAAGVVHVDRMNVYCDQYAAIDILPAMR